jgi:flagellar hook-associated protein 3 FlgL
MLPTVNGSTQQYLGDLDRIQSTLDTIQRQVSSGVRVGLPSDDPAAVPAILQTQSAIAMNSQAQTNLNQVTSELQVSDAALQQAIKLIDQAVALGSQAASGSVDDTTFATLAAQVQDIQQQMVGLSATSDSGRYVFSGDLDRQALYVVDSTQPNGVRQLATATSTRQIVDGAGNTIWTPKTAQAIFDAQNSDGTSAEGNVFEAVNSLLLALRGRDSAAAQTALGSLKSADDHVNQQLGLYGIGEARVADALNELTSSAVNAKQELSSERDTDVAAAAIQMSQATLQQQAALSARARISQRSLFDYLA